MDHANPIRSRPPEFRRRTDTEKASALESEFELRTALEAAGLGVFDYYPLSGELHWNSMARQHFGLSADAPVNYNVFLVGLHPDDRARVVRRFQQSMERGREGLFSAEFRTVGIEDRQERFIAMSGRAFFNQWGEAARMVATTQDMSARNSVAALPEQAGGIFRTVFDNLNEGILLHAADGSILDMNDRFLAMYKVGREQLRRLSIADISSPSNPLEDLPGIWERVVAGERQMFEWKARRPADNSTFDVEVFLTRIEMYRRPLILAAVRDISDKKRLEEAVRQSEERYRLLFDKSPLPKWVIDLETFQIMEANEAAAAHYGYSREEFLGLTIAAIRTPDEFKKLESWVRSCCTKGEKFEGQVQTLHRKKNGEIIDADIHYTEISYKGRRAGLGVIIDITERKQAEKELRESEGRYRALINASSQVLYSMNPDWSAMQQLQGGSFIADTEKPNRNWLQEYIHPDDQERVLEAVRAAVRTGTVFELEHRVRRADGTLGWTFSRAVPVRNAASEIVEWFGAARDITDRKRAEEAQKESEERYRSLFENLLDAFCYCRMIFDEQGRPVDLIYLEVNEAFEAMSGYANVVGKKASEVIPGVFEAHPEMFETLGRVAVTGTPEKFETYFTPADSWFEVSAYSTRKGYVAILFDNITHRKQAEEERERLIRQLQRSNSELQQFAYVASHDLQEPLRTVGSYVELLAQKYKGKIDETADKYIAYVVEGASRMSLLINDLLAFSRLGTQGGSFERVDMTTVLERAIGSLQGAIKESGAMITRGEMPAVVGDGTQLVLLMQNLLANAIKFKKPEAAPKVHISAERRERAWVFGVHDNGIGIEPRFYERIFVIFQRLHTREEYAGTGVGLAISKRVVERHGGRIWVESRTGEGSSFYFSMPDREVRHGARERRSGENPPV